jgi:hypothetical protein
MELAELERHELEVRARLMTDAQRAARKHEIENMIRLKGMMDEPFDPELAARGLARCRHQLREARHAS